MPKRGVTNNSYGYKMGWKNDPANRKKVVELYAKHCIPTIRIAERFSVSQATITMILNEEKVPLRKNGWRN